MWVGILLVLIATGYFIIMTVSDASRRRRDAQREEDEARLRQERALGLY